MKKVGLLVLVIFGFIGIIESLSGSPSNKEQDVDIDKQDELGKTQGTSLYEAVRHNDLNMAKLLLDAKADTNTVDSIFGDTPLQRAIENNNTEMVKLLIDAKVDVNKTIEKPPLHMAIRAGNIEITKLLIAANADVNIQDHVKNTPLHVAACNRNIDMVKLLIAAKANVNIKNECGENPLLSILESERRYFNYNDDSFKQIEILKLLINAKSDLNLQYVAVPYYYQGRQCIKGKDFIGKTALHFASRMNNIPAVKLLLAAGANKNLTDSFGKTALDYADKKEMKDLLNGIGSLANKEQDIDIDKQDEWGKTELHRAVFHKDIETVRILINKGANLNIQDRSNNATPLYIAISIGDLEIVKLLVNAKADVNIQNHLHKAVHKNNIEIVKLLISANADVNTQNQYGSTPLHKTIKPNNIEIAKLLIDAKADLNIQNKRGETPLHLATSYVSHFIEYTEIAKLLIDAKADVNIQIPASIKKFCFSEDYIGKTPLHFAVTNEKVEIIKLLLAAKANKNIKDNHGKTALDYAKTHEIKDILRNKLV